MGGGTTSTRVLVRSERPDLDGGSGWAALRADGVRSVLDLRQPAERAARRAAVPVDLPHLAAQARSLRTWRGALPAA